MNERDIKQELLDELKAERPTVEGFDYVSEDPLSNLIYINDGKDGQPSGSEYKVLLGGDPEKVQELKFHAGNPKDGVNGITLETLIDICIARTMKLNENIPHWHNHFVVDGLSLAANALNKRHIDREQGGVAQTDEALPRKGLKEFHPIVRRMLTNQDQFNFVVMMMSAISESYEQIIDNAAQTDFIEMTEEGPKRKVLTTPEEDEALTVGVASAQKLLAVFEQSPLFQTILGTLVHGKKLQAQNQQNTTPTSDTSDQPDDSTQEQI
jgi:hypothetical protein